MLSGVDVIVNEPILTFIRRKKFSNKIMSLSLREMSEISGQKFSSPGVWMWLLVQNLRLSKATVLLFVAIGILLRIRMVFSLVCLSVQWCEWAIHVCLKRARPSLPELSLEKRMLLPSPFASQGVTLVFRVLHPLSCTKQWGQRPQGCTDSSAVVCLC